MGRIRQGRRLFGREGLKGLERAIQGQGAKLTAGGVAMWWKGGAMAESRKNTTRRWGRTSGRGRPETEVPRGRS